MQVSDYSGNRANNQQMVSYETKNMYNKKSDNRLKMPIEYKKIFAGYRFSVILISGLCK